MDAPTIADCPLVTRLAAVPDFAALLCALRSRRGLAALDSVAGEPRRWSWIAFEPLIDVGTPASAADLPAWLAEAPRLESSEVPGPFAGGFLGALAYDQGVAGEGQALPTDPWDGPAVLGGFYTDFFVFDHAADAAWLVTRGGRPADERAELLRLAEASVEGARDAGPFEVRGALVRRVAPLQHQVRVERCRAAIAAGELYQANLAHPFEARTEGDPLALYLRLRDANPAPYMAYLRCGDRALLSASPELLLEAQPSGALRARPIKGTAPRSADLATDAALAAGLLASEKDGAELAMIVDLLRNDLGRVAAIGSVSVDEFPLLKSYAGVHHLMADVRAELAAGRSAGDALLSVFPGGSITGAPKLRAMQLIAELEREGRGFFTGSLGFLDARGAACFNILIRTLEWRADPAGDALAGRVRFQVGGGITIGSDPVEEERETLVKGARLAEALGFALDGPNGTERVEVLRAVGASPRTLVVEERR